MSEERPKGPFVLWRYSGYEGWSFTDHETFDDAVGAIGQWSTPTWVITEAPVKITWTKDTTP